MDRTAKPEIVTGSRGLVNLQIKLNGDQSQRDADAIGAGLRHAILETYAQTGVSVPQDVTHDNQSPRKVGAGRI